MFLLAAMGPPGGGRMVITRRLQSRFNLINMTFPQVSECTQLMWPFWVNNIGIQKIIVIISGVAWSK
jgi:hypothetical protein